MGKKKLEFNIFGRMMCVIREESRWAVYHIGDGKRRRAYDIVIPSDLTEKELETYLFDLFHELANQKSGI